MHEYNTVVGLDLSDKKANFCTLDWDSGEHLQEGKVALTKSGLKNMFGGMERALIVCETGTHSPWVQHTLEALGHAVFVADARRLRLISENDRKSDKHDAELLARLARADLDLLVAVHHRGPKAQADLSVIKAREQLVRCRAKTINAVRGIVKSNGDRLDSCAASSFTKRVREQIPKALRTAIFPLLEAIEQMTKSIQQYDRRIEHLCKEYPETEYLRTVQGVGPVTALSFILVLEQPERFGNGRDAAAYLGLVPRRDQSGDSDPQLRITKSGNKLMRKLLVQCAQYILSRGRDSELRQWGQKLAGRGGTKAKKRAVVAMARKLSVILYALWRDESDFNPFHLTKPPEREDIAEELEEAREEIAVPA